MAVRLTRSPARLPPAPARLPQARKVALPFYKSAEWQALIGLIKSKRGKQCEECGAKGFVIGDHVIELRDGGAGLDEHNIMLRCAKCHGRKTAQKRRERLGLTVSI